MDELLIDVSTLDGKRSELESMKNSQAKGIQNEFDGSYLNKLGETKISGLTSLVSEPIKAYNDGCNSACEWFNGYLSDLESIESGLASFKGKSVTAPTTFSGKFEDIFSKVTMPVIQTNGDSLANYKTFGGYVDPAAIDATTSASLAGLTIDETNGTTINIPANLRQRGYTVTCYGPGGWYLSGRATPTRINPSTKQYQVHQKWLQDGARYKNGMAVININGVDHYIVATAQSFGKSGRVLKVKLKNGQEIPCVIGDSKNSSDWNYTQYGHSNKSGAVNVLEFEVDRTWYNSRGNPGSSRWPTSWDSSSGVASITSYGSIV